MVWILAVAMVLSIVGGALLKMATLSDKWMAQQKRDEAMQ